MNLKHFGVLSASLLCVELASGCALVSRGDTLQVRYFTLDLPRSANTASEAKPELELRLGRVDATGALGEQLAIRTGQNELTYREDQRWAERPAQYVRRGLERALFEERRLTRAYSGVAPTLDVELVELETDQLRSPVAHVRLVASLHDDRRGVCNESFAASEPIQAQAEGERAPSAENVEASVASLSRALQRSLEQLAGRVVQCLVSRGQQPGEQESARASRSE
jgi:ABC-type uncharacterized transport system auxiliary subunit